MRLATDVLVSLVLPTRNRVELLRKFLGSFFNSARDPGRVEVVLMCDYDDPVALAFAASIPATGWNIKVMFQNRSRRMIRDYNNYGSQCTTGKYVWQLNDDFEMATPGWDAILQERIEAFLTDKPDRVAYVQVDDSTHTKWGVENVWGCCCPVITREALDAMNAFMPSEIDMWGADVGLWQIFRLLPVPRILNLIPHIRVFHHSPHNETAPPDEISRNVEAVSGKRELELSETLIYVRRLAALLGFPNYTPPASAVNALRLESSRASDSVQVIEMGYRAFNLLAYRGRVYALSQALGPFDLAATPETELQRLVAAGRVAVGDTVEGVKARVDQLQPGLLRRVAALFRGS